MGEPLIDQGESAVASMAERLTDGGVLVLSGAGLSTESGIPDYRGPTGRLRPATPMTYQEFTASAEARQRYWARSYFGWRLVSAARPNDGHRAVAALQVAGLVGGVITQNVDGLHQAAGATDVIELHGGLDRVACLHCRDVRSRGELDRRMRDANPMLTQSAGQPDKASRVKPDGDSDIAEEQIRSFVVVDCLACGAGPLKPDVVFFGENVPPPRVARCYELVESSRTLLVLGSSLTVASGFRFVRRAAGLGVGIVIVNQGITRGDRYADLKIEEPLGRVLSIVQRQIG